MDWIDELVPGRETDGQLAVSVFGWRELNGMVVPPEGDIRLHWTTKWDGLGLPAYLPKWSSDLEKAFEVHDVSLKQKDGNHNFSLNYLPTTADHPWQCWIVIGSSEGIGRGDNKEMAMLRAALRACKAVKREPKR